MRFWVRIGGTTSAPHPGSLRLHRLHFATPTPEYRIEISETEYRRLLRAVFPRDLDAVDTPEFTPPPLPDDHYFWTSTLTLPGHHFHDMAILCWVQPDGSS